MITTTAADFNEPAHNTALVRMMDAYMREMTGGTGLDEDLQGSLVPELARRGNISVLLALDDGTPAGFAVAVEGFSTFACKPVLNIHDLFVDMEHRRKGAGRALLAALGDTARTRRCVKLTLEVLEHNSKALQLYDVCGYKPYMQNPALGRALFYEKRV